MDIPDQYAKLLGQLERANTEVEAATVDVWRSGTILLAGAIARRNVAQVALVEFVRQVAPQVLLKE